MYINLLIRITFKVTLLYEKHNKNCVIYIDIKQTSFLFIYDIRLQSKRFLIDLFVLSGLIVSKKKK